MERADSVVWDAHKMLLMPALLTAVVFRNGSPSFHAFAQHASYLFPGTQPEQEWYNIGHRTLECTKRMMSLKLYAALRICGTRCFADYVTAAFDLGRRFGEIIAEEKEFELPVKPECNIVCFRHIPAGWTGAATALDALQAAGAQEVNRGGSVLPGADAVARTCVFARHAYQSVDYGTGSVCAAGSGAHCGA